MAIHQARQYHAPARIDDALWRTLPRVLADPVFDLGVGADRGDRVADDGNTAAGGRRPSSPAPRRS
jgi:hypothetical protein